MKLPVVNIKPTVHAITRIGSLRCRIPFFVTFRVRVLRWETV